MPAGGLVTAGAIAAGTVIYGAIQKSKAKKAQAALLASRPKYTIPQSEQDIQNLAASQASQGMGGAARQQLQNNTDRGLATNANAILMGGGDANAIGNLADKTEQGYNQNAIYDDQIRLKNLDNLQNAYARNTANQDKVWNINNNQPWKDQMTANTGDLQYANNVIGQGIGMAGSAAGGIGKALGSMGGGGGGVPSGGYGGGGYMGQLPTDGPSLMPASPGAQQTIPTQSSMSSFWGQS